MLTIMIMKLMMMMTMMMRAVMMILTLCLGRGALCHPRPNRESPQQHQQVKYYHRYHQYHHYHHHHHHYQHHHRHHDIMTGDWQRRTRQCEVTEDLSHSQRLVNFSDKINLLLQLLYCTSIKSICSTDSKMKQTKNIWNMIVKLVDFAICILIQ